MKRKFIRVLSVLCTLVVLACVFAPTAGAASFTNSVATKSESILLVNTDTHCHSFKISWLAINIPSNCQKNGL